MVIDTRYRALEILSSRPNLRPTEWGRLARAAGLYTPRTASSERKDRSWGSKAGKCLVNLGLAKCTVTVVKYGVNVSYVITDEGKAWLKGYREDVLKENT